MTQTATSDQQIPAFDFLPALPDELTLEERVILSRFRGRAEPMWNHLGELITVVGVLVVDDWKRDLSGDYILDEDGAKIPCKRCFFLTQDNRLYSSPSNVVYNFVRTDLLPVWGKDGRPGMLFGPVPVRIAMGKTKNGQNTFFLKMEFE